MLRNQITKNDILVAISMLIREDGSYLYENIIDFNSFITNKYKDAYDKEIEEIFDSLEMGRIEPLNETINKISITESNKETAKELINIFNPDFEGVSQNEISKMLN